MKKIFIGLSIAAAALFGVIIVLNIQTKQLKSQFPQSLSTSRPFPSITPYQPAPTDHVWQTSEFSKDDLRVTDAAGRPVYNRYGMPIDYSKRDTVIYGIFLQRLDHIDTNELVVKNPFYPNPLYPDKPLISYPLGKNLSVWRYGGAEVAWDGLTKIFPLKKDFSPYSVSSLRSNDSLFFVVDYTESPDGQVTAIAYLQNGFVKEKNIVITSGTFLEGYSNNRFSVTKPNGLRWLYLPIDTTRFAFSTTSFSKNMNALFDFSTTTYVPSMSGVGMKQGDSVAIYLNHDTDKPEYIVGYRERKL